MNKKVFFSIVFLLGVFINLYNFTDIFGSTAIPKFRPFGTSTTFADSTNYVTLNKGFYARDSIKTDLDMIVKGAFVLDTLREGTIQYRGYSIYINNDKAGGDMTFQLMDGTQGSAGDFTWLFGNYLAGQTAMTLDSATGLTMNIGNIQMSGGTQQIKLPSDTVSDYDANDAVTLNRQSGIITTKSLTTAVNAEYSLTLTNSLIVSTSKVFCEIRTGSLSQGTPIIRAANPGTGSATIVFRNIDPANAINGTVIFSYVIFN